MFDVDLFLPALAQAGLTLLLALATGVLRWTAGLKRQVRVRDIALGQRNWPRRVQQVSNALNNQWETPTLFYAGLAFAMIAGQGGAPFTWLAWIFVASRVAHALVYVTTNFIPLRFLMFAVGFVALAWFWIALAARVV